MEGKRYHLLFVGDIHGEALLAQNAHCQETAPLLQMSQTATYPSAIQAITQAGYDAVFVTEQFDSHSGLEFIHHARLCNPHLPVFLLCKEYDDSLDCKARKVGAADCLTITEFDIPFLRQVLISQNQPDSHWKGQTPPRGLLQRVGPVNSPANQAVQAASSR